jgi:hypothetical protein
MGHLNTIRAIAAGMMLAFSAASAHATVLLYATDYTSPEAPGTIASGGNNTGGGLCTPGTTNCVATGIGVSSPNGNGLISISGSTTGIGNYTISVILNNGDISLSSKGSVWDVTVVSGGVGTALGNGITTIVPIGTYGGGTVSGVVSGNGVFTIGITDLTEQYYGQTDNLPTALGASSGDGGTLGFTYSEFALSYTVTPAPEPASLSLFAGGIVALGTLRRRRRQ